MTDDDAGVRRSLDQLSGELRGLRTELVNREVYAADVRAFERQLDQMQRDHADLERRIDKADDRRAADRRLLLASFVLPVLLLLLSVYVSTQVGGAA